MPLRRLIADAVDDYAAGASADTLRMRCRH